MQDVLVNRLGGLSLPRKSVVRLTDRPDMTLDVYRGRKTTIQQQRCMNAQEQLLYSSAINNGGGISKMVKLYNKVFMCWARPCQGNYPVDTQFVYGFPVANVKTRKAIAQFALPVVSAKWH